MNIKYKIQAGKPLKEPSTIPITTAIIFELFILEYTCTYDTHNYTALKSPFLT